MADITIAVDGTASPDPYAAEKNSEVSFENNMTSATSITADPGLFPRGTPLSLAANGGTGSLTTSGAVSNGKKYYYDDGTGAQVPRHGVIDVG